MEKLTAMSGFVAFSGRQSCQLQRVRVRACARACVRACVRVCVLVLGNLLSATTGCSLLLVRNQPVNRGEAALPKKAEELSTRSASSALSASLILLPKNVELETKGNGRLI